MGSWVWGLGSGVLVLGFGVWGLGFGDSGFGFGVSGFGFRVKECAPPRRISQGNFKGGSKIHMFFSGVGILTVRRNKAGQS